MQSLEAEGIEYSNAFTEVETGEGADTLDGRPRLAEPRPPC